MGLTLGQAIFLLTLPLLFIAIALDWRARGLIRLGAVAFLMVGLSAGAFVFYPPLTMILQSMHEDELWGLVLDTTANVVIVLFLGIAVILGMRIWFRRQR